MQFSCAQQQAIASARDCINLHRLVYGADNDLEREVRISCPDATGLGCDVTRMLLDFGLRIVHGDMSTDGKWCFLIFRVLVHCYLLALNGVLMHGCSLWITCCMRYSS